MAKTDFKSVDDYIAAQPEGVRPLLQSVRSAIRKAVPGADEMISYQLPSYKLNGKALIYFSGWKQHWSLYPATGGVVKTFAKELAAYEVEKGTIRFPLSRSIPAKLVEQIAKLRAKEVAETQKGKTATTTSRTKARAKTPAARGSARKPKSRR
jgi:uncharacterized protein YdhG (YjbR/CyaY superfamily)